MIKEGVQQGEKPSSKGDRLKRKAHCLNKNEEWNHSLELK